MVAGTTSAEAHARADAALARAGWSARLGREAERRARLVTSRARRLLEDAARRARADQRQHEACAALQRAHAVRLAAWESRAGDAVEPALLSCVGDVVGAAASVSLLDGAGGPPALVASSGWLAQQAGQLELVLGRGPVGDCAATGHALSTADPAAAWPRLGAALERMGATRVTADPLVVDGRQLGVLTTLTTAHDDGGRSGRDSDAHEAHLPTVAAAVTEALVELGPQLDGGWERWVAADDDLSALVHCASGVVAGQQGCSPAEGIEVLAARAVVTGEPLEAVARAALASTSGGGRQ